MRRLQALLCLEGFDAKPIDGDFGPGTESAVKACQSDRGLPVTGDVDGLTEQAVGLDQPDQTKFPVPVIDRFGADHAVRMFSPHTRRRNIEENLPHILSALREADMDDRDLVLMALATIRAETEGFEPIDERVSSFNTAPGAHPFNKYDDRGDLGNRGRPDGERYKGRGFIQLTGRTNYEEIGQRIGRGSALVDTPELANEPRVAAQILSEFIKAKQNAVKYAVLGNDLKMARKLVNGGTHGLDRFSEAFETGRRIFA